MKKKDCLFLCQFFYPEYVSSATLPFDTAVKLAEEGYKIGALCGYPKEYSLKTKVANKEIVQNVVIKRLRYLQLKRTGFLRRGINYASFFFNVLLHVPYMGGCKLIFVYSNPPLLPLAALLTKRIFGCQVIFISYDVYPEIGICTRKIRRDSMTFRVMQLINQDLKKNADCIVALSKDMKGYFVTERKVDATKVKVIPNWYEEKSKEGFGECKNTFFNEIPKDAFVVSYLGNMGICQELDTILQTARILKEDKGIYFLFAGHGSKLPGLIETVKREQLNQVKILGFLQGKDYLDALKISSVCMVTLVEGMRGLCSPSKVYGYMMASKPIIAIMDENMELSEDIIHNRCGCVIKHKNAEELGRILTALKKRPGEIIQMGNQSRKLFERKYEKEICLNKYVKLIEERLKSDVQR